MINVIGMLAYFIGMVDSLDNVMENAYEYGRTGIETYVDRFLKDADKEQRRKLKEQILVIWDRIIQYWMDKKTDKAHGPTVSPVAITDSIGEIVYNEGKSYTQIIINEYRAYAINVI